MLLRHAEMKSKIGTGPARMVNGREDTFLRGISHVKWNDGKIEVRQEAGH